MVKASPCKSWWWAAAAANMRCAGRFRPRPCAPSSLRARQCRHCPGRRMHRRRRPRTSQGQVALAHAREDRLRRGRARGAAGRGPGRSPRTRPASRRSDRHARPRAARRLQGLHQGSLRARTTSRPAAYRALHRAGRGAGLHQAQGAPIVVKADGLAAGKGVVVAETVEQAEAAVTRHARRTLRRRRRLGGDRGIPGRRGSELLRAVRRRARAAARSARRTTSAPSTATPDPTPAAWAPIRRRRCSTPRWRARVMAEIILPTRARPWRRRGTPVQGRALCRADDRRAEGPKLIEYNCRFGDPESQVLMMRLEVRHRAGADRLGRRRADASRPALVGRQRR